MQRTPQRRLPAAPLPPPRTFLSIRSQNFSSSSSSSTPLPPPRLPDPPRGAHRPQASQPILPQTREEQYALDLIAKRKEASEPKPETGGIPGGTGPVFIVILLLVVLSLNYHRAVRTSI